MRHTITPQHSQQQQLPLRQMQHVQGQLPFQSIPLSQQALAQQQQQQQQQSLLSQYPGGEAGAFATQQVMQLAPGQVFAHQAHSTASTTSSDADQSQLLVPQQNRQQQEGSLYLSVVQQQHQQLQQHLPVGTIQNQQHQQRQTPSKQKSASHYGHRYNPMYPSPASSTTTPILTHASLSPAAASTGISHASTVASVPVSVSADSTVITAAALINGQSLTPQVSPHMNSIRASNETLTPAWSPAFASTSPSSTASMPAYLDSYEHPHVSRPADLSIANPLTASNLYARSLHTPFYHMDMAMPNGSQVGYGSQPPNTLPLLGSSMTIASGGTLTQALTLSNSRLPAFDVKAYTFRKKPRHYVAVKHKNALRIEPIIYLKTSILDEHRQVVRNWDYLRFKLDRFRENAQPKKKLNPEELRGARILDVDILLVSPNNRDRVIEDSCPACVMRMDGERRIMQVLAKNFKQSPSGEPLIDIRKGHAIVCIKLNCYCDHHNEQEGFVVRMQTSPEVVHMGGSVKLRICCEARSKSGAGEPDADDEDGLTDIDAPASTGSRSPAMVTNEQMLQSPSLSHESASSPIVKGHQRTPSTNSSSMASPRSMDERILDSSVLENMGNGRIGVGQGNGMAKPGTNNVRVIAPPKFRQIYPLTPSEGTVMGGTRVTIHGAHFDVLQNPVVYFGKVPAELVTISHHDVMECTTPPADNLKPGIVAVQIVSSAFPLNAETDSVDFMYMAPPDYDFCNLAATSLSYAMADEYPQDNSLAFMLNAHGSASGIGLGLLDDATTFASNEFDVGLAWSLTGKEDMALEFLRTIQVLAPGRMLPSFRSDSGHTLLHMATQSGMTRLVRELLDMGIDHTAMDRNNKTALHFARILQNDQITRMLAEARVPPRPMVPRLASGGNTITRRQELVSSLVQKYEEYLVRVVKQERHRKHRQLRDMRERALRAMEIKDQALLNEVSESSELAAVPVRVAVDEMEEEDDIMMEEISNPSSPEDAQYHDEDIHSNDESTEQDDRGGGRKRKANDDVEGADITHRKAVKDDPPESPTSKPLCLTSAQLGYIQDGISRWEKSRGATLFSKNAQLLRKTGMQTWKCTSWSLSSLKEVAEPTTAEMLETPAGDNILHVMALTATGLYHYSEQQSSPRESPVRNLDHWALVEIEQLACVKKGSADSVVVEMCGLVARGGRDLMGERIEFGLSKEDMSGFVAALQDARDGLLEQLKLRRPDPMHQFDSEEWIDSMLQFWGKVFNVNDRAWESVEYVLQEGAFTLKPVQEDNKTPSVFMMGAIMRMLRDYDQCSQVRFKGVRVMEDGWKKPELIKELERMVRERGHTDKWSFEGCGWSSDTAQGFLNGLNAINDQERGPCKEITLAGNDFGGEDSLGHTLAKCLDGWKHFEALDLSDCSIGLGGMEAVVGKLHDMFTIRLQGNQVDHRWWQWVDTILEKNPSLQDCCLGANAPHPDPDAALITSERLSKLQDLSVLDLSTSPINQATISVLNKFVFTNRALRTLTLSHCQLDWSCLVPLFNTLCEVNATTKFTLDISKNPLFESEASIQNWVENVARAGMKTDGVPFGIQMQGLIIRDTVLKRVLEPLQQATCFNEFNVKGLLIKRESQVAELQGLVYEEARARIRPEDASVETCRALGRVLSLNKSLIMLDISGTEIKQQIQEPQAASSTSTVGSDSIAARKSVPVGRSTGGFGREVSLAFPALAENDTLRVLTMDHNRFGEDGLQVLAEALQANKELGVLSCDGNDAFTNKALRAIEKVLPPFDIASTRNPSSSHSQRPSSSRKATFRGTMEEAQAAGYNSTLSIWKPNPQEILMHKDLLSLEVERQLTDFHRIESMQAKNREQEAKFGAGGRIGSGTSLLADARRRYEDAYKNREEYLDTYQRVIKAVEENNRRTLEYDDRKRMLD